jgi:uncharacterized protein YheU (UPF0270 family)
MSTLNELVREQVLAEGPEYLDGDSRLQDEYVDAELNAMTNVELLERISDALRKGYRQL